MVKITLTNQKDNSPYRTAILNLSEGSCLVNNKEKITIDDFKKLDFTHPLLIEQPLYSPSNLYTYRYDDFAALLIAPRCVYATLIQIDDPLNSQFEILPSPSFYKLKKIYRIPFSIDYHKAAKENINVSQLNTVVSCFSDFRFQFQDKVIVNTKFYFNDLPDEVDGDLLYQSNKKISQLLNLADDFERLELRYINHFIGFGVYARQEINRGDFISFYYGMKKFGTATMHYYFHRKLDSFNLGIDAREYGNIARFINHAPDIEDSGSSFIAANVVSGSYSIFGIEVVGFFALRDIKIGEQLLINYSRTYFENLNMFRFKLNGNLVNSNNLELHDNREQKVAAWSLFARNGIKQAIFKMIKRFAIIIVIVLVFGLFLKLGG